jgi:hypothetical protein
VTKSGSTSAQSASTFETDELARTCYFGKLGELFEGFDIPGEETLEDWLREQRNCLAELAAQPSPILPDRATNVLRQWLARSSRL